MCGIAGILGKSSRQNIETMVSAMHHRGPDDSGVFRGEGILLGMARLAILDLTLAGHQPMHNNDKSVWIVYNGEIYNFRTERAILEEKGHVFTSHSDTEVVLRMYEVYGDDFLLELDVHYKNVVFERRFRADLLVEKKVLVENKAIKKITLQDEAQLINYLKATNLKVGFLFNFGSEKFDFMRRVF